jgi:putative Mn2+ efflux pump MntP
MAGWSRLRSNQDDGLTAIRRLFLSLVTAAFLIGFVLTYLFPFTSDIEGWVVLVILGAGVLGQVLRRLANNRPFHPQSLPSDESAAGAWRTIFFLGFAFAESPLLLGFVFAFMQDGIWPYLVGLPLFLYGMARIAPTRGNLQRYQDRLTAEGSMISLVEGLKRSTPDSAQG